MCAPPRVCSQGDRGGRKIWRCQGARGGGDKAHQGGGGGGLAQMRRTKEKKQKGEGGLTLTRRKGGGGDLTRLMTLIAKDTNSVAKMHT